MTRRAFILSVLAGCMPQSGEPSREQTRQYSSEHVSLDLKRTSPLLSTQRVRVYLRRLETAGTWTRLYSKSRFAGVSS